MEAMEDAETPAEPALTSAEAGPGDSFQPNSSAPEVPSETEGEQTRPESSSELLVHQVPLDRVSCVSLQSSLKADQNQNQAQELIFLDQHGQPLQCERMVILTGESESREVFVMPSNQFGGAQVLLPRGQLLDVADSVDCAGEKADLEGLQTITLTAVTDTTSSQTNASPATKNPPPKTPKRSQDCVAPPLKRLPASAPSWAQRLRNAEKIGDSYRGYCATESELETILLLHKQQTGSVFGTRQSPSRRKPATRLMWKSQYVPYDGVPFVNAGSRAMVMECQYGPRRKGLQPKKSSEHVSIDYKATCPARIYIKKVRKFPEYGVPTDPKLDKHVVRQEQEKAFSSLRRTVRDGGGVLRYYMQLPTQKAHLYHDMDVETPIPPPPQDLFPIMEEEVRDEEEEEEEEQGGLAEDGCSVPSRLHPRVAEKINELVAQGHQQVYAVRKQLRTFVEREMFKLEEVPERHNLCYFPTVNDIKNHIHEAQKALQLSGALADTQWDPLTETVTLTLTPAPAEGGLLRGVLEGTDTLSPEAVQLFSSLTSLQPKMFAQLQGVQLQPVPILCSYEGPRPQSHTPGSSLTTTDPVDLPEPSPARPLLVSPSQFLQTGPSLCKGLTLGDPSSVLGPGQVVRVSSVGEGTTGVGAHQILLEDEGAIEVGAHQILLEDGQILLEDGQTVPVHIADPAATVPTNSGDHVGVMED